MKNFKKLFAALAITALLGSLVPVAVVNANYSEELQGAYDYAYSIGSTTMPSIESANMMGNLIRSHMAKMMSEYAKEVLGLTPDTAKVCEFNDIANQSAELKGFIIEACELGLMGVGITSFNPNGIVTRGEFGTVLSRALWGETYNDGIPYYAAHLDALKAAGVMNNISNPAGVEMRGRVMLMMQRAAEDDTIEIVAPVPGFVTVSRVGSITTQSVPLNAVNKKIGTIKLTAGENDTTVTSVIVKADGLGVVDANIKVKLLHNGVNVTTERAMSSSTKSATVRFSPNLVLKAGSSMEFDVIVSLSGASNSQHSFSVTDVIVVNGSSAGLPVTLGNLHTTSYVVGTIAAGDITINTVASLIAGKTQEKIADINITSPTVNAKLKGFTLTREEDDVDLRDVFANAKLYNNDVAIANAVVSKDRITVSGIDFDSIDGEQVRFVLKADTTYIGTTKTIKLTLKENELIINEINSGEEMRNEEKSSATFDLSGADFTMTKMTTGNKTYAPGTSSIELFNARITSLNEFEVTKYKLELTTTASGGFYNFTQGEVTVYVNGIDYKWDGTSLLQFTKDDAFTVAPGQNATIRVVGNAKATAYELNKTYQIKLTVEELKNPTETSSFAVSNKTRLGDTVTINNGTYTVTKPTSMPTNKTVLEGSEADVLFFNVRAVAEDQILKEVTVSADSGMFTGFATKVALMQGTNELKAFNDEVDLATGTLKFEISNALAKDTTVPYTIKVTVKSDEVESLGSTFQVNLDALKVVRSASTSVETTTNSIVFDGNSYQIASDLLTIALPAQVDKNTTVSFTNTSNYDIELISVKFDMTRNLVGGSYVNWSGTVNFLDTIGGVNAAQAEVTAVTAVAQVSTYTLSGAALTDETIGLTVDGTPITAAFDTNETITLAALATSIALEAGVATAVAAGRVITITAAVAGTPVALTAPTRVGTDTTASVIATTTANVVAVAAVAYGVSGNVPGSVTVTFPAGNLMDSSLTRVIELVDALHTVTADDYTVTIKELKFKYVDRNDPAKKSAEITETYNVSK